MSEEACIATDVPTPDRAGSSETPSDETPPAGTYDRPPTLRRGPLIGSERRIVTGWAVAPILLAVLALAPFVVWGGATIGELVAAAIVYGGLFALATGFVAHDRMQARQCPRCTGRSRQDSGDCATCGYDVVGAPRWRCDEGHELVLAPGTCSCGRRLIRRDPPRGIGHEVRAVLKAGGWILVFLFVIGWVLQRLAG